MGRGRSTVSKQGDGLARPWHGFSQWVRGRRLGGGRGVVGNRETFRLGLGVGWWVGRRRLERPGGRGRSAR